MYLATILTVTALAPPAHAVQEVFLGAGSVSLGSSATSIQLAPGYGYFVWPWLQATAAANINLSSFKETSVKTIILMGGPTFNIGPPDIATFLFLGLALRTGSADPDLTSTDSSSSTTSSSSSTTSSDSSSTATTDPTGVGIALFAGKRFLLTGKLTYRPSVGLMQVGTLTFVINALSLSYTF